MRRRPPRRHAAALAGALWLVGCGGEPAKPPPPDDALHELDLTELPEESVPGGLFGAHEPDLRTVTEDVARLANDARSRGLFVRVGSLGGAWGARHDLAQVLGAYRATGKPVHCHFTDTDNVGYALMAQSCDRISVSPAGTLNLVGPALQLLHARQLLDRLGVEAEMVQIGKYKGAAEPFTRDDVSEPLAESLNLLLDDLSANLDAALKSRTQGEKSPVDGGPYGAREALEAGLVDGVDYDDAARAKAKTAADARNFQRLHEPERPEKLDLATVWKALSADEDRRPRGDRLAYVVLSGEIVDGSVPRFGNVVADPTIEALRQFADDPQVKAVVVRIDSPGGSALASDRIWHAVRRVAGRKPVAVSVGNMAASGGYYIASAATRIFAAPASLVGSIGVVGGKVNVAELAGDQGVHTTTLTRGPQAAWLSPLTPFSDGERGRLETMLERIYRLFLHRVSLGRDIEIAQLTPYAEGRLMTAKRAAEGKLVDEVGSLHEALLWARQQAGLPDAAPVQTWPGEAEAMAALTRLFGGAQAPSLQLREWLVQGVTREVAPAWVRALARGEHVSTVLPVQLTLH